MKKAAKVPVKIKHGNEIWVVQRTGSGLCFCTCGLRIKNSRTLFYVSTRVLNGVLWELNGDVIIVLLIRVGLQSTRRRLTWRVGANFGVKP